MEIALTVHVQNAGTADYGILRKCLEFNGGDSKELERQLDIAVEHFVGNAKRQSENAAATLAHAICISFENEIDPNLSDDDLKKKIMKQDPVDFKRDKNGCIITPTKCSIPLTFPERIDYPVEHELVTIFSQSFLYDGMSQSANAVANEMRSRHNYMLPGSEDDIDYQLLRMHALQNAVVVVNPELYERMAESVTCENDNNCGGWLPGFNTIDTYLIQETPEKMNFIEYRKEIGMNPWFSEKCIETKSLSDPGNVTTTFTWMPETKKVFDITNDVEDEFNMIVNDTSSLESFVCIKVSRGVSTLYTGVDKYSQPWTVALYNWHASRKGDNFPKTYALASKFILQALKTSALKITPDADILCIIAGDSNLKDAKESAEAATELEKYGLEMFNSSSPDGSDKCCKPTVIRGPRSKIMSTQWNPDKVAPTTAMKDVLVVSKHGKGNFEVGAFVPSSFHPQLDHKGFAFTVYRKEKVDVPECSDKFENVSLFFERVRIGCIIVVALVLLSLVWEA